MVRSHDSSAANEKMAHRYLPAKCNGAFSEPLMISGFRDFSLFAASIKRCGQSMALAVGFRRLPAGDDVAGLMGARRLACLDLGWLIARRPGAGETSGAQAARRCHRPKLCRHAAAMPAPYEIIAAISRDDGSARRC